jgi:hypothetical protein
LNQLRAERRDLNRSRHQYRGRRVERRLSEIAYQLDQLKAERRRAKRAWDNRRQPRRR